jgi:membrane protease subunit HflC
MRAHHTLGVVLLFLVLIGLTQSVYTVDQTQQAIVLQLGNPVGSIQNPGLHFKTPFIQDVVFFDRRVLSVDPPPAQVVISSNAEMTKKSDAGQPQTPAVSVEDALASGEPIIVDTFARYQITDPLAFLKTLRTVDAAESRLESILNDASRSVLGKTTLRRLLSSERNDVMKEIADRMNAKVADDKLGIKIVDIRIVRADLTPALREATVQRMISELKQRATQTRAEGDQHSIQIKATADKEKTVILADAQRDAQITRGEGDKEAIKTYADAFNKDKDFYSFTRSLEAYRNALATPDTRLILSPDSEFLKVFRSGMESSAGK